MNTRRRKQAKGLLGMALAALGGIVWFFQEYVFALVLWGGAILILFSLNRRRKRG